MLELQLETSLFKCLLKIFKKLILALTVFALVAGASKKVEDTVEDVAMALERVPCIHYLIWFKKNQVQTLLDLGSEVNAITLAFVSKLGLQTCHTNVKVWRIDGSTLETLGMILASF